MLKLCQAVAAIFNFWWKKKKKNSNFSMLWWQLMQSDDNIPQQNFGPGELIILNNNFSIDLLFLLPWQDTWIDSVEKSALCYYILAIHLPYMKSSWIVLHVECRSCVIQLRKVKVFQTLLWSAVYIQSLYFHKQSKRHKWYNCNKIIKYYCINYKWFLNAFFVFCHF